MKTDNPIIKNYFTDEQVERLGNTIIYLADRIKPLSKTKLLKLIYLIEEISVKKYGVPFFNIPFEVWELGPVSRELYIELDRDSGLSFLKGYFTLHSDRRGTFIKSARDFDDNEFNDIDLELLDFVFNKFKGYDSKRLIELTHSENSIWRKYAKENNLIEAFANKKTHSSSIEIDLSKLLPENSVKKMLFQDNIEHFEASRSLKD